MQKRCLTQSHQKKMEAKMPRKSEFECLPTCLCMLTCLSMSSNVCQYVFEYEFDYVTFSLNIGRWDWIFATAIECRMSEKLCQCIPILANAIEYSLTCLWLSSIVCQYVFECLHVCTWARMFANMSSNASMFVDEFECLPVGLWMPTCLSMSSSVC